jgi:hypothetical protein
MGDNIGASTPIRQKQGGYCAILVVKDLIFQVEAIVPGQSGLLIHQIAHAKYHHPLVIIGFVNIILEVGTLDPAIHSTPLPEIHHQYAVIVIRIPDILTVAVGQGEISDQVSDLIFRLADRC